MPRPGPTHPDAGAPPHSGTTARRPRGGTKQHERLLGPLLQLGAEEPRVPVELAGAEGRVGRAGVADDQVGPADRDLGPLQRRQDLLVDAVTPADVVAERKEPDLIHDGPAAAAV